MDREFLQQGEPAPERSNRDDHSGSNGNEVSLKSYCESFVQNLVLAVKFELVRNRDGAYEPWNPCHFAKKAADSLEDIVATCIYSLMKQPSEEEVAEESVLHVWEIMGVKSVRNFDVSPHEWIDEPEIVIGLSSATTAEEARKDGQAFVDRRASNTSKWRITRVVLKKNGV